MDAVPDYDSQLSAFHQAFEAELQGIIDGLPLTPEMNVLDLACGDGFYTRKLSGRLGPRGLMTGVDLDPAYLLKARSHAAGCQFVLAAFASPLISSLRFWLRCISSSTPNRPRTCCECRTSR